MCNRRKKIRKKSFFRPLGRFSYHLVYAVDCAGFLLPKLHIFSRSEKSWGDKQNVNFRLKMTPQAKKMTFFGFFFFCCTSSRRDETFLLLPKFHIFSRSEKSWGDQKKRYINNERRRRTNDDDERRRTTLTMIIARQDSFRILGLISFNKSTIK